MYFKLRCSTLTLLINGPGRFECEVLGSGPDSMESGRLWAACKKDPGHPNFIPYPEFSLDHLPIDVRTQENYDRVMMVANRTVRLTVRYTSMKRPDGYPFSSVRGTKIPHTGTGFISPFGARRDYTAGSFLIPISSNTYELQLNLTLESYVISVTTARHVVFDEEEAEATQIDFFYDDENSEFNGKMKTTQGLDIRSFIPSKDTCTLLCSTQDKDLMHRLWASRRTPSHASDYLHSRWNEDCQSCVIVSHPHGQPKKIRVGKTEWVVRPYNELQNYDRVDSDSPELYTASTCPGSSGALVLECMDQASLCNVFHIVHTKKSHSEGFNEGFCSFIESP